MCISELERIEVLVQYTFRWSEANTRPKEIGGKGRKGVIAGIVGIGGEVFFKGCKIIGGCLNVIPVKRGEGEEWGDLYRHLQAGGMGPETPVVDI